MTIEEEVAGDFVPSFADEETEAQAGKRSKGSEEPEKELGSGQTDSPAQIPAVPQNCCVTLRKPLNISESLTQVVERMKSAISI